MDNLVNLMESVLMKRQDVVIGTDNICLVLSVFQGSFFKVECNVWLGIKVGNCRYAYNELRNTTVKLRLRTLKSLFTGKFGFY